MPEPGSSTWQRLRKGRVRILWLVLGALLLVSALPIGLYHRQVLQLSQDKLGDNERVHPMARFWPRKFSFSSSIRPNNSLASGEF